MAEWQPIETAPKDGTWILVYESGGDYEGGINGYSACDVARFREWHTLGAAWRNCAGKEIDAIYWQPLPEPPTP